MVVTSIFQAYAIAEMIIRRLLVTVRSCSRPNPCNDIDEYVRHITA